jgi:adenylate cyclase
MGYEIERKFLLENDKWRKNARGTLFRQGYMLSDPGRTVRIRTCNDKGYLTIKGLVTGISRPEFEYEIPDKDANFLLDHFCDGPILEKIRHLVEYQGFTWEIDEFLGENAGLLLAEIELTSEDQIFPKPQWIGEEVSGDPRYFNSSLVKNPYTHWQRLV